VLSFVGWCLRILFISGIIGRLTHGRISTGARFCICGTYLLFRVHRFRNSRAHCDLYTRSRVRAFLLDFFSAGWQRITRDCEASSSALPFCMRCWRRTGISCVPRPFCAGPAPSNGDCGRYLLLALEILNSSHCACLIWDIECICLGNVMPRGNQIVLVVSVFALISRCPAVHACPLYGDVCIFCSGSWRNRSFVIALGIHRRAFVLHLDLQELSAVARCDVVCREFMRSLTCHSNIAHCDIVSRDRLCRSNFAIYVGSLHLLSDAHRLSAPRTIRFEQ
jgi:hypothetical protein